MAGTTRQADILRILQGSQQPISGTKLGELLGVSRQMVVQDIALLRASGHDITSTNRGYVLHETKDTARCLVKVRHTREQIEEELNAIVDLGGAVEDVFVNHRNYGIVSAPLDIKSRRDVRLFLDEMETGISQPLMDITCGYHFHHISAPTPQVMEECISALTQLGFVAQLTDYEIENLQA